MSEEHRCGPGGCTALQLLRQEFEQHHGEYKHIEATVERHDKAIRENNTVVAVINTKLSAILWGIGVIGTALIGVLVKMLFG